MPLMKNIFIFFCAFILPLMTREILQLLNVLTTEVLKVHK